MVKRLSGLAPPNGYDLHSLNQRIPYATTNRKHLVLAKENLSKLAAIGITEHFKASIMLFNSTSIWKGMPELVVTHRHKSASDRPKQSDLKAEVLNMVYEYNQFDLELYEHALRLLQSQSKLPTLPR